jgi:hypothetical protein
MKLPNILPTIPVFRKPTLCLWMWDYSTIDIHRHDIAIDVSPTIERKLLACDAHATQFYENAPWERGILNEVPENWEGRKEFILKYWPEYMYTQDCQRAGLEKWYGTEKVDKIQYAETFQIAPYGFQPSDNEIRQFFPMLLCP